MPRAKGRSYIAAAKSWKIRNMIEGYVRARLTFVQHWRPKASDHHLPSFETFQKICNILQYVKDDHYLLYRRAGAASRNERHKLVPGSGESAFINLAGLLFHKAMVAKELRYILDRYAHDERNWEAHFQELQTNLSRLEKLFEQGQEVIAGFVRSQSDNVLVLAFLLENQREMARCFGIRPAEVLGFLTAPAEPQQIYYAVGQYYFESGWYDRAHEMAKKAAQKTSTNGAAQQLLQRVAHKLEQQKRRARAGQEEEEVDALATVETAREGS